MAQASGNEGLTFEKVTSKAQSRKPTFFRTERCLSDESLQHRHEITSAQPLLEGEGDIRHQVFHGTTCH
jgi:hypothetical protein